MKTVKSFEQVNVTPWMLAEEAGRRIINEVVKGRIKTKLQLHAVVDKLGKGAEITKETRHFAMALMLVR